MYNKDYRYLWRGSIEVRFYRLGVERFMKKNIIHCPVCVSDKKVQYLFPEDTWTVAQFLPSDAWLTEELEDVLF